MSQQGKWGVAEAVQAAWDGAPSLAPKVERMTTMAPIGILLAVTVAAAAPSTPARPPDNRASVMAVRDMLLSDYPIAEVSEAYASRLNRSFAEGRYKGLAVCDLADRLNADLQAAHKDLHLSVGCKRVGGSEPQSEPASQNPIERADWLPGLPAFYVSSRSGWPLTEEACQQVFAAMTLAGGARYVVVDVRDNPGGSGIIGNLIASYFYPLEDGHVLVRGAFRDHAQDTQEGTYPYVPGPRLPDAKVFIVVNKTTGSAAEGFAFGLQKAGRAKIVGQTTAGAGIAVWRVEMSDGLVVNLPRKLILGPDGSRGWEGVGVTPDIRTEPGKEYEAVLGLIKADMAAEGR